MMAVSVLDSLAGNWQEQEQDGNGLMYGLRM